MKRKIIYSVSLQNLGDFSFNPGAKEFREKYSRHEYRYSYFSFDLDQDNRLDVERDLDASNLEYEKFYELELDDGEIAAYPAFTLTIPALYDLVGGKSRDIINFSELGDFPIAQDFRLGVLVADADLSRMLAELNPALVPADARMYVYGKKKYQILNEPPRLVSPRVILNARAVKENMGEDQATYYADGWDGRSAIAADGVEFINNQHLVASWLFSYEGVKYRQNTPDYLISGQLASRLFETYSSRKLQFTPITFDRI